MHKLHFDDGKDANSHTVRCRCGWAYSSTWIAVRERGGLHKQTFVNEHRRWDDPMRQTIMPHVLG